MHLSLSEISQKGLLHIHITVRIGFQGKGICHARRFFLPLEEEYYRTTVELYRRAGRIVHRNRLWHLFAQLPIYRGQAVHHRIRSTRR